VKNIRRYDIKFEVVETSVKKLNPQFSLCDILVLYHGDNRNLTSIAKPIIEDAHYSLYGVPIVGEWIERVEDKKDSTWGSHGGRIVIDEHGVKFEQTTRPFGFVTQDAVDNAEWVMVTEKDGHTKHEYLKLSGCILWNERYEECNSLLEKNYGQSMEIEILDGDERPDGYFDIHKYIYSALCILGTAEPCFESAMIGRHYAFDAFKEDMRRMLNQYKESFSYSNKKEDASKMHEKLLEVFSAITFKSDTEKDVAKYEVISVKDGTVDVIDRESGYKGYSIPYSVGEDKNVTVDFENAEEKSLVLGDASEVGFNVKDELSAVVVEKVSFAIAAYESDVISELNASLSELRGKYEQLETEYATAKEQLNQYEEAERDLKDRQHKTEVDAKIDEYSAKMGDFSEYLIYRTKVDYSKTVEQIDVDMLLLLGRYHKSAPAGSYSYKPQTVDAPEITKTRSGNSRYGDLLDKVQKTKD